MQSNSKHLITDSIDGKRFEYEKEYASPVQTRPNDNDFVFFFPAHFFPQNFFELNDED